MMEQPKGDNRHCKHTAVDSLRTRLDVETLKDTFISNLFCVQGRSLAAATRNDCYMALAYTVRDRLLERWIRTRDTYFERDVRMVCYLSAEFLTGPHLENNLINLGIYNEVHQAMEELNLDLEELISQEEEPAWAMVVWGALPPASSIPWPRSESLPWATASATSSECSTSRSATAGRWSSLTSGCASGTPGRSPGRKGLW